MTPGLLKLIITTPMLTTNPPTPKGSKARVLRNALLQKGDRITISPNDKYPSAQAEVLRFDVDVVEARVIGGDLNGSVWLIQRSEFTVDVPTPDAEASASNTSPFSQVAPQSTPKSEPLTSEVTPENKTKVFEPGLSPKRLRQQLAAGNVNLARGGKAFESPRLRKARIDAVACLQAKIDGTTQLVHEDGGLRVHLDWLQGVGATKDMDKLLCCVANFLGETVYLEKDSPRKMGVMWQHSGKCANGFQFFARERCEEEGGGYHVLLSFPGSLLSSQTVRHWWKMCKTLRRLVNFRATRFDSALDDYDKTVSSEQVREAIRAGNVKGINTSRPGSYELTDSTTKDGAAGGWSNTLGSPNSRSRLCYYNKEAETRGALKCYRFELRLRDEYAAKAFDDWLAFGAKGFEEVSAFYLAGLVVSYFDFRDRSAKPNEKNFTRLPRYEWWQNLIDRIGAGSDNLRHSRSCKKFSVERSMRWIERQVVTTLVILKKAMGRAAFEEWLGKQMARAEEFRLSRWHRHLIATFASEVDSFVAAG